MLCASLGWTVPTIGLVRTTMGGRKGNEGVLENGEKADPAVMDTDPLQEERG